LEENAIHPAIRAQVAALHRELIDEVQTTVRAHAVVVIGMSGNPFVGKARKALDAAGVPHEYREFGSYLSQWRRRNALKMWTGWPTFPMVFVRGVLVGGCDDVRALIASGELAKLLAA
jgi:glutaredoxin-related protein